jgi:hypothetical protein
VQLPAAEPSGPSTTLFDITVADNETGPPFCVDTEPLTAGEDDAWATQRLTIVSEWDTPIAVIIPPSEFVLDSRQVSRPPEGEMENGEPTILQSGASLPLLLELKPRLPDGPASGIYQIDVPITYWRNVDPDVGPTGPPENTLILQIRYDILDARTASAIRAFCEQAVDGAADLTEIDQERLDRGLDIIEAAASELPQQRGEELVAEIAALRLRLEEWFGPDPGHSGFSTGPSQAL